MRNLLLVLAIMISVSFSTQAQTQKDTARSKQTKPVNQTATAMQLGIPASLQEEHKELHENLVKYTQLPGKTGAAAKALAKELHPHFEKEEQYALPLLGLLAALAKGQTAADSKQAIAMADTLKLEFDQMLKEHQQIVVSVDRLGEAAKTEKQQEVIRFTEALKLHALTEEEVLYPAAILIGEYLKLKQ